jgi:antitoxin ParD1/3/4
VNFLLSAELEELIRRKVASGAYASPAQVVEEALWLLEERDHLRALRRERLLREIAGAILEADNRQVVDAAQVLESLAARANAALDE